MLGVKFTVPGAGMLLELQYQAPGLRRPNSMLQLTGDLRIAVAAAPLIFDSPAAELRRSEAAEPLMSQALPAERA